MNNKKDKELFNPDGSIASVNPTIERLKGYAYSGGSTNNTASKNKLTNPDGSIVPINGAISRLSGAGGGGYSGGGGGSVYDRLLSAASAIDGKKQTVANNAANRYVNMSYEDFLKSDDYASLAKRWSEAGQAAMQDTLGEISARTGGLASSYAASAAQTQYNDYMARLEDAARSMYQNELSNAGAQAAFAQSQADTQYGRTQDLINLFTSLENRDYTREQEQKAWDYQLSQDEKAAADAKRKEAAQYVLEYISMNGSTEGLNPVLVAESGLDSAYLNTVAERAKFALANEGRLSLSDAMSAIDKGYSGSAINEALGGYLGEDYRYTPPVKSTGGSSSKKGGGEISDYQTLINLADSMLSHGATREDLLDMFIDARYGVDENGNAYEVDAKTIGNVINGLEAMGLLNDIDRAWLKNEVIEKYE